jgi:Fibrinogen beta and gamma chains, C-terminal globular domain
LTRDVQLELRANRQSKNDMLWHWAEYSKFRVDDESTGYNLNTGGDSGVTQRGMTDLNGIKFTTRDRDNDLSTYNRAAL